jgi:thiosulfate reductase cytochrome b subunit
VPLQSSKRYCAVDLKRVPLCRIPIRELVKPFHAVLVAGLLSILTGWAIHKPMQLYWLTWIFGGYDKARIWHFWLMWVFVLFVAPHVILVLADGWDTLRSMIVGWSTRAERSEDF